MGGAYFEQTAAAGRAAHALRREALRVRAPTAELKGAILAVRDTPGHKRDECRWGLTRILSYHCMAYCLLNWWG